MKVSCLDTVNGAFVEDVEDELQIMLKSLLNDVEFSNIIELWRIHHIDGLLHHKNIVTLLSDKTHISRWYKDSIVTQLDINLKSLPFQKLEHNKIIHHTTPLRNQFGIAFSISKTAINIALETNSDEKLIRMLKNFITIKWQGCEDSSCNANNSCDNTNESVMKNGKSDEVVPLQRQLINQITDPKVVKIHGALSKKRIKSITELSDRKVKNQETSNGETSSKA
ncbi:16810_t:CDS:2 [Cetraspora pellucida]|uniref:16810_t:CDS:1 n=1 Tax=Cetraspora pellucida TaxID=1433469 RepID=A0ACA9LNB6_9GLOM|nr:16810_t:CDS:2 [Cetraspora pellucida]